ncbi:hypothetical protein J3B02_001191 [Coemansia erecta]|nr:hypothetical protein J3B02_001191 [Coemansia erecta]KAJ2888295.1 hypothetical protein FB639_000736 [Coemansia asiatica]
MQRLEWVNTNGTANGDPTFQTGSEDCWIEIHGSDNLAWYQFDAHKVGWIIAGVFALVATIISTVHICNHLRHYTEPRQQRHIVRIILIIPIYSIISFLSYRFYREAPYYTAVRDCYEAFSIAAFYMLLLQYIGDSTAEQKQAMLSKRGLKWTFPFNCFKMNPAGRRTFVLLKWGILQYVVISPTNTLVTIITHANGVFCPDSMRPKYAHFWVAVIDFVSITVAMYALVSLYRVIKEDVKEQKPFLKFVAIKAIVFVTFWEGFVISWLGSNNIHVIKGTKYWSKDNVVEGLTALIICIEMVLFAALFIKAFPYQHYKRPEGTYRTPMRRAFIDSLNFTDFFLEIWFHLRWLVAPITRRYPVEPDVEKGRFGKMDINGAARYGIDKQTNLTMVEATSDTVPLRLGETTHFSPPEPAYASAAPAYYRAQSNFPPSAQ